MKKEIIHFSKKPCFSFATACGIRYYQLPKTRGIRNKVTCKRCKATKRFKKIK